MSEEKIPVLMFPALEPEPENKLVARRGLDRDNLTEYQEEQLIANAKKLLPRLFKSLANRLDTNDSKAADQVLQMYGYTKAAGGVVINNLLQQNNNTDASDVMYFEGIIKKLESRDRPEQDAL